MKRSTFIAGGLGLLLGYNPFSVLFASSDGRRDIYLTIDDGPNKNTDDILNKLKGNGNVSFFFLGENLDTKKGFEKAYRAVSEGHSVGNHSYSHPYFSRIELNEGREEIERTHELIERIHDKAGIQNPRLFRFPYGDTGSDNREGLKKILIDMGYSSYNCNDERYGIRDVACGWTLDSKDWKHYMTKGEYAIQEVLGNVSKSKEHDVILSHSYPIMSSYIIPSIIKRGNLRLISLVENK
ncbi:MAG: polysaccharide deacetylase family protein [Candidatus Aenigmarchaeota archaeon]|nr:polysaccharide deacetylase family protein [Candidatus Aenigmarchaeota archaeon]